MLDLLDDFGARPRTASMPPVDDADAPPSPAKSKSKKRKNSEDVGAKSGEGRCVRAKGSLFQEETKRLRLERDAERKAQKEERDRLKTMQKEAEKAQRKMERDQAKVSGW